MEVDREKTAVTLKGGAGHLRLVIPEALPAGEVWAGIEKTVGNARHLLEGGKVVMDLQGRPLSSAFIGRILQEVVWSQGKPTRDEVQLGLRHYELRGVKDRSGDAGGEIVLSPTEEQVFRMAGRWSLDPMMLAGRKAAGPGLGVVGHAPMVWQSERVRRIA